MEPPPETLEADPVAAVAEAPPEAEPIATGPITDLAVGLTAAPLKDLPIAFDTTLGWAWERVAFDVSGRRSYREVTDDTRLERTVAWGYGASVRVVSGDADTALRGELAADLAYDDDKEGWLALDSDAAAFSNGDTLAFGARLGGRFARGPTQARLSLGLAWSRTGDDAFARDASGADVFDEVRTDRGLRTTLRARLRRAVWRDRAAVRVVLLAQDQRGEQLRSDGETWTLTPARAQFARLRTHLDLDVLRGVVSPTVFFGADLAVDGEAALTPLVGVGVVRGGGRD